MADMRHHLVSLLRVPLIRQAASGVLGGFLRAGAARKMHIPSEQPLTIMQIGGRGGPDPYTKWLRQHGKATVIGVEPESSGAHSLQTSNAYDHVVTQAISNRVGKGVLYLTKARQWCSLLEPDIDAIRQVMMERSFQRYPFEVTGTEEVELTTLDALKSMLPSIDYLQIDVQGAELMVLQGAVESLKTIGMVELETRFYRLYKEEPLFPDIHSFFTKHGFVLIQLTQQGEHEFGNLYVEANACYLHRDVLQTQPAKAAALIAYAKNKHAFYAHKILRLYNDLQKTHTT